MDSDINIEQWAKTLGFEKSSDKMFLESWKKLVPPQMKNIWRHIITHVQPADKANYIRKLCLLYNLEMKKSINKEIKLQANIKSLKAYKDYQQWNDLNITHLSLNGQIESLCKEIDEIRSKLEFQRNKHKNFEIKEKEKLIKSELIKLKIKSTYEEIKKMKEMQTTVEYLLANSSDSCLEDNEKWGQNIIQLAKALPKGQEIESLREELDSLSQEMSHIRLDPVLFPKIYHDLEKVKSLQVQTFLEAERSRAQDELLKQQISESKERTIQQFVQHVGDSEQAPQFTTILTSTMEDISNKAMTKALIDLKNSWAVLGEGAFVDEHFNIQTEISVKKEDIRENRYDFNKDGTQDKLIKFCIDAQKKIKEEPKTALSEIKLKHPEIVREIQDANFLPREVDLLLKLPYIRKDIFYDNVSVRRNPAVVDCLVKLDKYTKVTSELKFELPNVALDADEVIKSITNKEMKTELQLKNHLEQIKDLGQVINKLKLASQTNLEFWKTQPLAEESPSCSEDYKMWRERLKEATKALAVNFEDLEILEESE